MDIRSLLAIAALAGGTVRAQTPEKAAVPVCMTFFTPSGAYAQWVASKMFEEIGVKLEWLRDAAACRSAAAPLISIHVTMPPTGMNSGALARSLVYEGTQIEVFYERVRKLVGPRRLPTLLGHVLAHEIAHVLQGVSGHTETGVMKARWDNEDYDRMAWKPFSFTESDAILIHLGLKNRKARLAERRP
jgi:hypothetical protein